jgi:hypothetical protein
MTPYPRRLLRAALAAALLAMVMPALHPSAQGRQAPQTQKIDEAYTALIKEHTQDPRITTELVDHLPASDTVPSPLKFHGRIVGTPDELTYAKDIHRYFDALDKASDRVSAWSIGKSEEGRDMYVLAVADAATIRQLEKYKGMLHQLSDPRKTTEEQAQRALPDGQADLLADERHPLDRERRPEMLMELAYRLACRRRRSSSRSATTSSRSSRRSSSGRPREAGGHLLLQQERAAGRGAPAAHVLGQVRRARQQPRRHGAVPQPHAERDEDLPRVAPTVLHDLHEQPPISTPRPAPAPTTRRRPITVDEWWLSPRRGHGDDQARRARRVDLRVLRRLDAELHVLHRQRAQRDRPLLRGQSYGPRTAGDGRRHHDEPRVVPARTRRCRRSSGGRATTPTSSSRACSSR